MTDHSTCNSADLKVPTYLHYKNISDGLFGGDVSVNQITRQPIGHGSVLS